MLSFGGAGPVRWVGICGLQWKVTILEIFNSKLSMSSLDNMGGHSQLIENFQADHQQLLKIKEQNRILSSLNQKVSRKEAEVEELQKMVFKYKKYYDEHDRIAGMLAHKTKQFEKSDRENKILMREVQRCLSENKVLQGQLLEAEKVKHDFLKERNSHDKRLRDIQDTFREYQDECRNKEKQLLADLEKAYRQIKDLNEKCEDLQVVKFQNQQLKSKLSANNNSMLNYNFPSQQNIYNSQLAHLAAEQNSMLEFEAHNRSAQLQPAVFYSQNLPSEQNYNNNKKSASRVQQGRSPEKNIDNFIINGITLGSLSGQQQIELLKKQLSAKELELQRSKNLNHELSIQFDKSVHKICEFEKELSAYRKENHQLKRTLSLFVEKEQYEKMHQQKLKERDSEQEDSQEESWTGDEGYLRSSQQATHQRFAGSNNSYGRSSERA